MLGASPLRHASSVHQGRFLQAVGHPRATRAVQGRTHLRRVQLHARRVPVGLLGDFLVGIIKFCVCVSCT